MNIENIYLPHAYTFGPLKPNDKVDYRIEATHPNDKGAGVYAVTCDDTLVYIGSYQGGVQKRWVYLKDKDIYHFKKPRIVNCLKNGQIIKVFALGLDEIKKQIGCVGNQWVNAAGIESHMIASRNPEWNTHGKE